MMDLKIKFSVCLLLFLSSYALLAQVGINTTDPSTTLDVNGAISLGEASAFALGNGDNTNIATGGFSIVNIAGPTTSFNINSIAPEANADGQLLTLVNTTNNPMIIKHNDGAGVNSIYCPNNTDLILRGIYTSVTMQYNKTLTKWVVTRYTDDGGYGDNIYSSVGTTDTQMDSKTFADMADMSVTFTPKKSVVYVNVSISGHMNIGNTNSHGYADFRIVNVTAGNTVVSGATVVTTDNDYNAIVTPWNMRMVMIPVTVTPGQPTTIKTQWRRDGTLPRILYCLATSNNQFSHRSITIID
ncbi:hypothetical protein [Flavobacterium alkalisoli]|uniref:hypothetical protein n=1 Tax=Flavobacterium alkalisoli TaxID=2602769 RepID=UPI003A91913E